MADDATTKWGDDFCEITLGMRKTLLHRLDALGRDVPTGVDAFLAWHQVETHLNLREHTDPPAASVQWLGTHSGHDVRNTSIRNAVVGLLENVWRALDAGLQCPIDPIYRERDLPDVKTLLGDFSGWRAVWLNAPRVWPPPAVLPLPDTHPLRLIPPYVAAGNEQYLLLGPTRGLTGDARALYRHSQIAARTARGVSVADDRIRQEQDRIESARRAYEQEAAKMEAQASALRKVVPSA